MNARQEGEYLSTTALAKKLGKESRQLFALFEQCRWLVRVDGRWQLTAKGRFEGGIQMAHHKYGEYVAWPQSILLHAMLVEMPDTLWTVSKVAAKLQMPARLLNLFLSDLGWVEPGVKGWKLTPHGRLVGGRQDAAEGSGVPFVRWPPSLTERPELRAMLEAMDTDSDGLVGLGGRQCKSPELRVVDSWLYLQGLHYAVERKVSGDTCSDIYFPKYKVHFVIWPRHDSPAATALRLGLIDQLVEAEFDYIELRFAEGVGLVSLDEQLARLMLQSKISVY